MRVIKSAPIQLFSVHLSATFAHYFAERSPVLRDRNAVSPFTVDDFRLPSSFSEFRFSHWLLNGSVDIPS